MGTLHPYQLKAAQFLRERDRAALWIEMGLGKTAATLAALDDCPQPVLVIAPKKIAEEVWPDEVLKWRPDLRCEVAAGTPGERARVIATSTADIVVIGKDNVPKAKLPPRHRFGTIVVDESAVLKSPSSQLFHAVKKISAGRRLWQLTGTPAPNGMLDLWAQVYLIDGGQSLGEKVSEFKRRWFYEAAYAEVNGRKIVTSWDVRPENRPLLLDSIKGLALSMQAKDYLTMPDTFYLERLTHLGPDEQAAYTSMKKDMVAFVDILGEVSASTAAVLSSRLRQISSGFVYPDFEDRVMGAKAARIGTTKIQVLREMVDAASGPVMVFYQFQEELAMIRDMFPDVHTAKTKDLSKRWNAGQIPLLAAHPKSMGYGLNLQYGGDDIIWMSRPWGLGDWQQANARLLRQGRTRPVMIHSIVADGTVDASVGDVLAGKANIQQAVLDHLK